MHTYFTVFSVEAQANLWKSFLWQGVTDAQRATLLKQLPQPETLPKGAQIYRSGQLGILLSGSAKIYNAAGNVVLRELAVSGVFGSASMFGAGEYNGCILAEAPVQVLYLTEAAFRDILLRYPTVSMNYITFLSGRVRFLNGKIHGFTAGSAEDTLLRFCHSIGAHRGPVELPCSMRELAVRLNIGRSSLYRAIDTLTENGILHKQDHTIFIKE